MPHDRFNRSKIGVGSHCRMGENILGIKNIETLVFHRSHIEVGGGNNHEALEIELQPKARFIPAQSPLQGRHAPIGLILIPRLNPDL